MIVLLTRASDNQPVSLIQQLANSGEGEVWETNLNGYLAKIYHQATTERIEKLKVMLANPPVDPMISFNHISIAWPKELLKDSNGNYVGFLMPAIRNSQQLSSIYNPSEPKKIAPGFNWYHLHVTALNLAWIIQEIHAKGYVLGDIKTENILVNDRALVAVIDTDSFQVSDSQIGKINCCAVGSEGFTPLELLRPDIATTNQSETHDRFGLAVLIHYLLFGYHPVSGKSFEQTELICQGFWYDGQNSLICPSQNTISLDIVHPEIKKLFLQCFNEGHVQPNLRPTAQDWHDALQVAVNELTVCDRVDSHYYSRHYSKCYWCERATTIEVDIFPSVADPATIPSTTTPTVLSPQSSNQTASQPTLAHSNHSPSIAVPPVQLSPSLQMFTFDVVTLKRSGLFGWGSQVKLNRSPKQAQHFTEDLGNGVILEMVSIAGGSFMMGAPLEEEFTTDRERPQHGVIIKPFFMGKFQVTQAQWRAVASLPKVNGELNLDPSYFKGDNLPVERVSWYDAVEFCARLSKRTGREYRLPSEAEWEYACRAETTTPFHFGETITTELANYHQQQTTPVGQFPPNAFGLYDMHGNVWEWCADIWHENYEGAPTDGSAWLEQGNNNYSPLRGGSWNDDSGSCRSAFRINRLKVRDLIGLNLGFRVVCGIGRTV